MAGAILSRVWQGFPRFLPNGGEKNIPERKNHSGMPDCRYCCSGCQGSGAGWTTFKM